MKSNAFGHAIRLLLATVIFPAILQTIAHAGSATLLVRTSDDTGMPLAGVQVRLEKWSTDCRKEKAPYEPSMGKSDDRGHVWFRQVSPGNYRLYAFRKNFSRFSSDEFELNTASIVRCEIRLVPDLPSMKTTESIPMKMVIWPFPSVVSGDTVATAPTVGRTIPEVLERIPGVLINPETGHPLLPSLRSSDVGLYIDDIPLLDPADHRPGFFPPALFTDNVFAARAGIDVDQVSSIGGNINLESPGPGSRLFTGIIGISDCIDNASFIDSPEAADAFDYWSSRGGSLERPVDPSPKLVDRRYQWLLKSRTEPAHIILAGELRSSNRGYTSDIVSDDALDASNTWFKATRRFENRASLSLTAGFETVESYPEDQWRLRGLPPLETRRRNIFAAMEFRKRFGSTFWYDILLAGLSLSDDVNPPDGERNYEYPYGLGAWTVDSRRRAYHAVFKGGRITRLHAVETGFQCSWLDTDILEGFEERENSASSVSYFWKSEDRDYEFSMWGRDRWFMNPLLEIGLGIRWDRFAYLEESDYLSPRFYGALNLASQRVVAGVERIIQSPGIGYISDETVLPVDSELFDAVTEPQQGFRWFGTYQIEPVSGVQFQVEGHYSFLTRTVVMLPIESEPGIEFIMPVSGESGRNMGLFFDAKWDPHDDIEFTMSYGFNHTRLPWGENIKLSFLHPYPEMPWRRVFYNEDVNENMPLENDLNHSVRFYGICNVPWIDLRVGIDYRWTGGLHYTRFYKDAGGEWTYDPERIYDESGDAVQRLDIAISRIFAVTDWVSVECHVALRNALNTFQFPRINPYTGDPVVDPYRMDYNQPRTVTGSLYLRF